MVLVAQVDEMLGTVFHNINAYYNIMNNVYRERDKDDKDSNIWNDSLCSCSVEHCER